MSRDLSRKFSEQGEIIDNGRFDKFQSPLGPFPRPLALDYSHLAAHYATHTLKDRARGLVATFLTKNLLHHYFLDCHTIENWHWPQNALFSGLPSDFVDYFTVQKVNGKPIAEGEDTKAANENNECRGQPGIIQLLFITVVDTKFLQLPHRKEPGIIRFIETAEGKEGIELWDEEIRSGNVVFLAGKSNPIRPNFDFYTFNVDSKSGR